MRSFKAVLLLLFSACYLVAQEPTVKWNSTFNEVSKSFIENKGQFDGRNKLPGSEILYAVDHGGMQIFFTRDGLTYYFEKKHKNPNRKKGDRSKPKLLKNYEVIHLQWEGADPNALLTAREMTPDYHTYSFLKDNKSSAYAITGIRGFKKLVYLSLYPGIDVEYAFHPENGIKYSLILHPGADISKVKMQYSDDAGISLDEAGRIIFPTMLGDMIEHAPVTFYADNNSSIESGFVYEEKIISFHLGNYDRSKTIVVDPWVQTPALSNSNGVWECEKDGSGNVYIIGGDAPMRLRKYNSTGALQWTYNTPWDTTAGDWLGTLATDLAGNSYVTNGSLAELQKINTNGSMIWYAPAALFSTDEYWSVQFNCDQTKLVVGGTRLGLGTTGGYIYDINTNNGNIINEAWVATTRGIDPNEVRAITSSRNAKYYYLTLDSIGMINQNFSGCGPDEPLFSILSTYNFGYKCENYRPDNGNSGICAIRANDQFVYSQNGTNIHKRSLTTGAILATAAIPGGISVTIPFIGGNQPGNSGIDIDDCGNVYAGSGDRVIKYDADLNYITSVPTAYRVYDVTISYNGEVIVCGATGNNSITSRTGYVEVIDMGACNPFALVCCDPTICRAGPYCQTDAPVALTPITPGGTWSGTGITNPATGTFSPSVAGVGTHTITYTLGCGSDSIEIIVNFCAPLEVCIEQNGQYTVSGGTGPYAWETGTPFQNCSACFLGTCIPIICPGFPDTTWTVFANGATVTPPGTFPIRVRDSGVNSLMLNSAAGLPGCASCPAITVSASSQTNLTCAGTNNGSATVSASGGATPYTYTWQPGNLNGASQSGLSANNYTITATDANGCTGTGSVTITSPPPISLNLSHTDESCVGNDGTATVAASGGTPSYSYSWSNGAITNALTGLQAGNYSVTVLDANTCSSTNSVTINLIPGFTFSVSVIDASCGNSDGSVTITTSGGTPPFTYSWSTGDTAATASNLPAGSYSAIITDNNSCSDTAVANVANAGGAVIAFVSKTDVTCNGDGNGAINISVSGGTAPYSYSWSNGALTEDISGLSGGSYFVIVDDTAGCIALFDTLINEPSPLSVSGTVTHGSCTTPSGAITLTVNGGVPAYAYSWSNGATTQNLTNIAAGSYVVTVTDNNLCTEMDSFTVNAPGSFTITLVADSALCAGSSDGSVASAVSGGNAPFQYSWSTGAATSGISNVPEGTYSVTVTDFSNCSVADTATVEAPQVITAIASITKVLCQGGNNGGIKLIPFGGTPDYTALWSNGDSGLTLTGLAPGIYTATITDANDCTADTTINLTAASVYEVETSVTNATCGGSSSGSAQANIINGTTPPYTFNWSTGDTLPNITNLAPGAYTVTVSDSLNCLRNATAEVGIGSGMMIEDSVKPVSCPQSRDGAVIVNVIGGAEPFVYSWSNGANTAANVNIGAGTYYVTVTDDDDCVGTDTALVWVDTLGNAECDTLVIFDVFTPNGDGANDRWVVDGLYNYSENELQIFNRWGSLVFEAKPYLNNWDGRSKKDELLPAATYYYILKLNDANNSVYSGTVTLIR